ncbi:PPC domain-containing protein [Myxococcus sp. 1LA]
MQGKLTQSLGWVFSAMLLGACGPTDTAEAVDVSALAEREQGVLYPPPLPLSGNIVDSTAFMGPLNMGGSVQTQFTTQPQYLSFAFNVAAGGQVALEVTHLGSSMYLDTGLFVYGPKNANGSYGTSLVAVDDDAGYGQLSKIASLSLPQGGEYLAVVSTGTGTGKRFRLQLNCLNDNCVDPALFATCDLDVATRIEVCVQALVEEVDPVLGSPYTAAEAFAACTDTNDAYASYVAECAAPRPKPWCANGQQAFLQQMWPVCQDFYRAYYGVGPLELGGLPLSGTLQAALAAGNGHCKTGENWCDGLLATYTVPGVATVPQSLYRVADAVLYEALGEAADHYRFERMPDLTYAQLGEYTGRWFPELLQAFPAELGNGTETPLVAHYHASYPVAPGAKDYHHLYVVLFPQSYKVAAFQVIQHEI